MDKETLRTTIANELVTDEVMVQYLTNKINELQPQHDSVQAQIDQLTALRASLLPAPQSDVTDPQEVETTEVPVEGEVNG